ncbi:MAG: nucleoside deaminase [Vampirovibrionales bacterium]|nr:nucleoside deaminase [Vampirovibrionales bacterium]
MRLTHITIQWMLLSLVALIGVELVGFAAEPASHDHWMQQAIGLSQSGTQAGGGPFGAVIIDASGKRIGSGHNRVALDNDPTAHGEVMAIRDAAKRIGNFNLSGATLYTSTFPCPMCYAAAKWANIKTIYYANRPEDVAPTFDDSALWKEMEQGSKHLPQVVALKSQRPAAQRAFQAWVKQMKDQHITNYNPTP